MALKVELNGGPDAPSTWTDITDKVRIFEGMRIGGNAHQGQVGTGSGFDLDDDEADVTIPIKRVVRFRDTATSPDTILVRARVATRVSSRGAVPAGDARAYDVQLDDQNADLRGIPIRRWSRPSEPDYKRVIALWKRYLKGSPRKTTRLRIDYVRNANRRMLPKQTYRDTDPAGVLQDIADAAGKEFFVTVDGELFYDLPLSLKYPASLSITDDDPNMTTEFPPQFGVEGDHDGSEFLSGATLVWGKNKRVSARRATVESNHDYHREIIQQDATSAADARRRLKKLLSGQAREDLTVTCWLELTDQQMDLIKYGQTVSFRSAAVGVLTPVTLRVGRLMWEPTAPGRYRAHLELGFPKKILPRIRRGSGSGGSGGSSGVGTPSQGTEVTPPAGVTQAYLDHFDRESAVPTIVDYVKTTSAAADEHTIDLPEGIDTPGRTLLIVLFGELHTSTLDSEVEDAGFTNLSSYAWDPGVALGTYYRAFYRLLDGNEGYAGDGTDTLTLEYASTGNGVLHATAFCLSGAGTPEASLNISGADTDDPPELDPSVATATPTLWLTLCVSDTTITGDPTGYTNQDSDDGGTVPLNWRLSKKEGTAATEDPSTYTAGGTFDLAATIAIPSSVGTSEGLGSLPLGSSVGGWWPGGNEWQSFFAAFVGDHGLEDGAFFAESAATHETSGNNWVISVLGSTHPDGGILLPLEVDSWEMEGRWRLRGAKGNGGDAGERYLYLDWLGAGRIRLNFGDGVNAEGIQAIGETTDTETMTLPDVDEWARFKWRWHDGSVYAKVWAEGDSEPDWQVSTALNDEPGNAEMIVVGRLGNESGPVMRVEIDWLKMLVPDSSLVGYAGEVYGIVEAPAA